MKQRLIAGVVVMIVLLGTYLAMRTPPQTTVRSPLTLKAVAEFGRVEVLPAGGKDRLVMERREDGWWLTKPLEARLLEAKSRAIEAAFSRNLRSDDLAISPDKADEYRVSDAAATALKVFAKGATEPTVDLLVGKRIKVQATRAERTFVRAPGKDKIHRLQTSLAFLHDKDAADWRSKQILFKDSKEATSVTLERAGEKVELVRAGEAWEMKAPVAGMVLEASVVEALVSGSMSLVASGFETKKKASELGLEPPQVTLTVGRGTDAPLTVYLGEVEGKFWAKVPERPELYEITGYLGRQVMVRARDLKTRVPQEIARASILSVTFAGDAPVRLVRKGSAWSMASPEKVTSLDPIQLEATWTFLEKMRVSRYVDAAPGEQGFEGSKERVVIKTDKGEHVLVLGSEFGESKERYARFEGAPEVFVLTKNIARRLAPTAQDFLAKEPG